MSELLVKFTFDEMKACQLALMEMDRDIKQAQSDPRMPWNPHARATQREIRAAVQSAIKKISKATGIPAELPDVDDSEHEKYITKPS